MEPFVQRLHDKGLRGAILLIGLQNSDSCLSIIAEKKRQCPNAALRVMWCSRATEKRGRQRDTSIQVCAYRDIGITLGQTNDVLVLQDAECLTPNSLFATIETVAAGGIVILSIPSTENFPLNAQKKLKSKHFPPHPRLVNRLLTSLKVHNGNGALLLLDSESLQPLPTQGREPAEFAGSPHIAPLKELKTAESVADLCATTDQKICFEKAAAWISHSLLSNSNKSKLLALTAARGRGKSAALGLIAAHALELGISQVSITAPHLQNAKTLMDFAELGCKAAGFEVSERREVGGKSVCMTLTRICTSGHSIRQFVKFDQISDVWTKDFGNELLMIDEAASIPITIVKQLLARSRSVIMASTIQGYEGTGRALALKLFCDLEKAGRLTRLELSTPIRYGLNDPIESWLGWAFALDSLPRAAPEDLSMESQNYKLCRVNRDRLFTLGKENDLWMASIIGLFVSSHYKNSANDILTLADAAAHQIFVLVPKEGADSTKFVACAIQVAFEGGLQLDVNSTDYISRGPSSSGDMMAWKLSEEYCDPRLANLVGCRIVRIATHPQLHSKGFGTKALRELTDWLSSNPISQDVAVDRSSRLLIDLDECSLPIPVDYVGTSFGLTHDLWRFWRTSLSLVPAYLAQAPNDITGEFSMLMIRGIQGAEWHLELTRMFLNKFLILLSDPFSGLPNKLAASVVSSVEITEPLQAQTFVMDASESKRLTMYAKRLCDRSLIRDLWPKIALAYFTGQLKETGVRLSPLESCLLIGIGLQHVTGKTDGPLCMFVLIAADNLANEFSLAIEKLMGLTQKLAVKLDQFLNNTNQHKSILAKLSPAEESPKEDINLNPNVAKAKLVRAPVVPAIQQNKKKFKNLH